jgi:hypothetical protein
MQMVMSAWRLGVLGAVLATFVSTAAWAQKADLYAAALGTWELNVSKSSYSPGPAPKSQRRTYTRAGQGLTYTATTVDADGTSVTEGWTGVYDGKDYPFTGIPDIDTQAVKAIDPLKAEFTLKKGATILRSGTRVISKDGKVMPVTVKGTNARGEAVHNVMVFDKR